jgi:hypothetical protein
MKKNIYFASLLLLCVAISVSAQNGNNSGYIITLQNDTIKGFLENNDVDNYKKCRFRKEKSLDIVDYLPGQIQAYRYNDSGKYFISNDVITTQGRKSVFLEYLIKGKANIYFMRDNTEHYYIQKETDELVELSEIPELTKNDDGVSYYKAQKYTGKLKYLLQDCPEVFPEIDNVKLNPTQLITLAKDYHDKVCNSEQCIIYERKIIPIQVSFGLYAGVSYNNFYLNSVNYSNNKFSVYPGFRLEIKNLFFSFEQLKLLTGLSLHYFSTYNFHVDADWVNTYLYHHIVEKEKVKDVDLKAPAFRIPVSVNYTFTQSGLQPYVGIGFSNLFVFSQNKEFYLNNVYDYYGYSIPIYNFGIEVYAGLKLKINNNHSLFFDINFEKYRNFNPNLFCRIENQFISSQFGIEF